MIYVAEMAEKNSVEQVMTFYTPLFWKAKNIQYDNPDSPVSKITLVIGHLRMSYAGSIGTLMSNSGYEQSLEEVYAGDTGNYIKHTYFFYFSKLICNAINYPDTIQT